MTIQANEKRDCTVKALAAVAQIEYDQAHSIAKQAGRKDGRKFSSAELINHAEANGFAFTKLPLRKATLGTFLKTNQEGRFYVRKNGHAFAVIDGEVSDKTSLRVIVKTAWQLKQAA